MGKNIKNTLKQLVRAVVYAPCWEPLWDCIRDFGAVMMIHSISYVEPNGIEDNQSLRTSPECLDQFLTAAKKKGFTFVSMDEIIETLAAQKKLAKCLAFTGDDGYLDNFEVALPIMKAHNAPLCVNLATGLMSGETIAWWDVLEQDVLTKQEISLPDGRIFPTKTIAEKEEAFRQARWWIQKRSFQKINDDLVTFFRRPLEVLRSVSAGKFLPVEKLPDYTSEPLLSLGCHTHSHFACENFTDEDFRADVKKCLQLLAEVGVKPRHFAFPYGRGIPTAEKFGPALSDFGFVSAAITVPDVLTRQTDPFFIPRLALSEFPQATQLPYVALTRRTILGKV
ncbi:MAG: polysaccharide deacetylase family protein [Lentisphaerae bacterium]|nr:polysaccharide deacetylase family protein [Lentisphaerota bacterium]